MNRRQIIRLSFLPFLLPVAGGAAAPQESQGKGSAVCRAASDGGGTARRPGTGSVSYTHLDVYKRQAFPPFSAHQQRMVA